MDSPFWENAIAAQFRHMAGSMGSRVLPQCRNFDFTLPWELSHQNPGDDCSKRLSGKQFCMPCR